MGRTCVTPCCRTGYPLEKGKSQKIGPKPALFKAPKGPDLFKNWKQNLPRKEFLLTKSSFVSELHFLPEDVQNTYSGVPSDITALQTVRKRLRPGAVPVLWPGCPNHLSRRETQKKKPPKKRDRPNSPKERTVKNSSDVESDDNSNPLALNNRKRKMPDDNEKTSSQSKKNRLTDPGNEEIGFEDSDVFDMTEVFLDPSLVADPDLSREIMEYPSGWMEVKRE
ncbi:hypothetical protein OUZ56_005699 [Daphnia magna]|uniref:THAP-type domain-containing protein n=1 Tax=Daphnia magna TaxID=35525 RepID=A0ABQ9YTK9_9CRUS|nr:hypothetical protein OUZ56_005699 [Daphnia magna]